MAGHGYIPAAGRDWLLPFYDPFGKIAGVDSLHRRLIAFARIAPGERVLEIGCGTGSLSIRAKRSQPEAAVQGLDPDPRALTHARAKAARARVEIPFEQGFAETMPYPDGSFDVVLSSLMLHHIADATKQRAIDEVRRVLRPGGRVCIADFAGEGRGLHAALARLLRHRQGSQSEDAVLALLRAAGFRDAQMLAEESRLFGVVAYYRAEA